MSEWCRDFNAKRPKISTSTPNKIKTENEYIHCEIFADLDAATDDHQQEKCNSDDPFVESEKFEEDTENDHDLLDDFRNFSLLEEEKLAQINELYELLPSVLQGLVKSKSQEVTFHCII